LGRPRVVTTLHEFGTASFFGRARILFGAWRSERVIVPDEELTREVRASLCRLPFAPPVVTIPVASTIPVADGVNREAFRARHEIPDGTLIVGWFGLLTREKGADVLARALHRASKERRLVLVLIGDLGDQPQRLPLLSDMRTATRVIETGVLSPWDAATALASVDVVALPFASGLSGRRTSYLAAVAQGIFVVTASTNRLGYDERSNTRFVAPGDDEALANALLDPALRRPREPGPSPWLAIAHAHLAVYQQLVER
jgi:glycosyltransferase involved in cell wall biosynthesis